MAGPVIPVEPEASMRATHDIRAADAEEVTSLATRHDVQGRLGPNRPASGLPWIPQV